MVIYFYKHSYSSAFWVVALIAIMTAQFQTLLLLFWIVLWHELGHVVAAHMFSWRVKRILLLPFGGVAEMDEHGNRPFHEELIVTLAGPFQHIFIFSSRISLMKRTCYLMNGIIN